LIFQLDSHRPITYLWV